MVAASRRGRLSGGGQAAVDCSVESRENEWGVWLLMMLLLRLTRGLVRVDAYRNGGPSPPSPACMIIPWKENEKGGFADGCSDEERGRMNG